MHELHHPYRYCTLPSEVHSRQLYCCRYCPQSRRGEHGWGPSNAARGFQENRAAPAAWHTYSIQWGLQENMCVEGAQPLRRQQ
jgi:hypothetical protein